MSISGMPYERRISIRPDNKTQVVACIKNRQGPRLHVMHKPCVRTELKIKEKCIKLCTSLLPLGKAAAIAKIVQMIFTTAFTSEEMLSGFFGAILSVVSETLIEDSNDPPINGLLGAIVGGGAGVFTGLLPTLDQPLFKKCGLLTASGIGGIGVTIGLRVALKILEIAKQRLPCIRQADIDVGDTIIKPLQVITGLFGATLVQKVVLKVLNSLV